MEDIICNNFIYVTLNMKDIYVNNEIELYFTI